MRDPQRRESREPSKPLVLVVDDNDDARDLYEICLRHSGFPVLTARDGREALALARVHHPAVVVMDLMMPGMDGWAATRALKADPALRDIKVIVLTGHALSGSERSVYEAGGDRYLTKPCLPETLEATVLDVLGPSSHRRAG